MRWLARTCAERPVATTMLILVLVVFGLFSYQRLSVDLMPDMNLPVVAVMTAYRGAGPAEIESLVSIPIEEAVSTIAGVNRVQSVSQEGASTVVAEFEYGTDMEYASLQVREKVEQSRVQLPDEAGTPMIFRFDPGMMPVLFVGVGGPSDTVSLRKTAEDAIKPALERISGVAAVDVVGGDEEEIRVTLDQEMLAHHGITFDDVAKALSAENVNIPGGSAEAGKYVYVVRTVGQFQSVDQIGDIVVGSARGAAVHLRDVARVERTIEESNSLSRLNGKPSVGIQVRKQSGASTVEVSRLVRRELDRLATTLPVGVEVRTFFDQAKYTQHAIQTVYNTAYQGSILAVAVLYLFLQSLRHTLVIGVSIPVSVIATFLMMYAAGLTVNMMSLGGLALGVGMMVDNSIVVLENIYRWAGEGKDPRTAVVEGTVEVGGAIFGSTVTNVAVFLPILFVSGITGQIFRQLALTVTFSLTASLVVALTVVPMVCYRILLVTGGRIGEPTAGPFRRILAGLRYWTDRRIPDVYGAVLRWALAHRGTVIALAALSVLLTVAVFPFVGREFLPTSDEGLFTVSVEMPAGTKLAETDRLVSSLEAELSALPEVDAVFASVGQGRDTGGTGTHVGSLSVQLVPKAERSRSTAEVMEVVRQQAQALPGARTRVQQTGLFSMGQGAPVVLAFKGKDIAVLEQLAERAARVIASVPGTRDVRTSVEARLPEAQVLIDRDRAARFGLTTYQVAGAVRSALMGQAATYYRVGGDEISIRLRLPEAQRKNLEDLSHLRIPAPTGDAVTLGEIGTIVTSVGPTVISRDNQSRVVSVSSSIAGRDLASVMADISARMRDMGALPPGYSWEFSGQAQGMSESFTDLGMALSLAVVVIYMLLAAQFESVLQPLVIMLTVPLSALGAIWGLFLTNRTITIISYTGFIMLVGIVVNNAIVLIEYVNILRRRDGMSKRDALLKAGPNRLRPILMTSLTTILGLVPLCLGLGEGAETEAPLATVLAGGLSTSTMLTLVLIPVAYDIVETASDWIADRIYRKTAEAPKPVADRAGR
ncbi:MAG: efflux RND transporter permease subunit [Firmicutes bacterium]|jgi:HAE1 family hydrophobic/amphiphilic exporter-1|nr:efflux RND transporter permease subunit [Bacillota bacterium]